MGWRKKTMPAGFTLVEMLVVITIIGILAALLIPAVSYVRYRAQVTRIAMEVDNLAKAVESYRNQYGDYPPDFSDKRVVDRHIRRVWPRIAPAELTAFHQLVWVDPADPTDHRSFVDPAEALVFWLGGFSTDPKFPFTGPGGPLMVVGGRVVINPERNQGIFEFDEGRLTQAVDTSGGAPVVISTDEQLLHGRPAAENDPFPVYLMPGEKPPYVYFDSRTYGGGAVGNTPVPPPVYPPAAYAATTRIRGVARPYVSDQTTVDPGSSTERFKWVLEDKFQIISAGMDGHFGADHLAKRFPSGANYLSPEGDDDNITNFSEGGTLEDMKP